MTTGASVNRERGAALSGFIKVLCANPTGDSVARAMVVGALAPLGAVAGQIYGIGKPATLELLGNFGWQPADASAFRTLAAELPLPTTEAYRTVATVAVPWRDLAAHYPLLAADAERALPNGLPDTEHLKVVCVPIVWAEASVGALLTLLDVPVEPGPAEWQYLDGVAGAIALWLHEQRRSLIDAWRRAAPLPHADVAISPTQHRILELVGDGKNDEEIATVVGLSLAMVRKELTEVMLLIGTEDRRAAAGRAREIGLLPDRRTRDGAH